MPRIVDLSVPIEPHFRWPMERSLKSDFAKGDSFQVTWLGLVVHGFTHIDAVRHILPDGATSSDTALEQTCGPAAVLDLSEVHGRNPVAHECESHENGARDEQQRSGFPNTACWPILGFAGFSSRGLLNSAEREQPCAHLTTYDYIVLPVWPTS